MATPCPLLKSVTIPPSLINTGTTLAGEKGEHKEQKPFRGSPHVWATFCTSSEELPHPTPFFHAVPAAVGQLRWEIQYFYSLPFKSPALVPVAAAEHEAWTRSQRNLQMELPFSSEIWGLRFQFPVLRSWLSLWSPWRVIFLEFFPQLSEAEGKTAGFSALIRLRELLIKDWKREQKSASLLVEMLHE